MENEDHIMRQMEMGLVNEETKELAKINFRAAFDSVLNILKKYVDMREEYYTVVALWILGTYLHKEFSSYPYLFLNGMKGSGKSRLLRLIAILSFNGKNITDLTEAGLFRTAKDNTICIDEAEKMSSREKGNLRQLLNAGYKKGIVVERQEKAIVNKVETRITVPYELFGPKVLANIFGLENVLGDRTLPITLEKSSNKSKTLLIEDFEENEKIAKIKEILEKIQCSLCNVFTIKNIIKRWNYYVNNIYTTTSTTNNTLTTDTTQKDFTDEELELFNKIKETGIEGRNLELLFPLLIVAKIIDYQVFETTLKIAKEIALQKREEDYSNNDDIALIDFVATLEGPSWLEYHQVNEITGLFRNFIGAEPDDKYINSRWVGRALKRLNLISNKKRLAGGSHVRLNLEKAKNKIKMFKEQP